MGLKKVISGGQTGADQAGIIVASRFGLETGGMMPKGFKTLNGPNPQFAQKHGLVESESESYPPRTYWNAANSDGTVRMAGNFETRGEVCTLNACIKAKKPHFDVDLTDPPPIEQFIAWLDKHKIETLNVAGNSEESFVGASKLSIQYLTKAFFTLGFGMWIDIERVMQLLDIDEVANKSVYANEMLVLSLRITQKEQGCSTKTQT